MNCQASPELLLIVASMWFSDDDTTSTSIPDFQNNTKPPPLFNLWTKFFFYQNKIKEDNSTDIDEQNIAEIINLKELSKPMVDPPLLEKDAYNRQNFLSLIDRVIFQKWHT